MGANCTLSKRTRGCTLFEDFGTDFVGIARSRAERGAARGRMKIVL
jgi:hypothetical protein